MSAMKRARPSAQEAIDTFVATQLLDNGMDVVAKKINRLRAKLAPPPARDDDDDDLERTHKNDNNNNNNKNDDDEEEELDQSASHELDAAAKKKYARRLQHWLAVACRLLHKQREQVQAGVEAVELELKKLTSASASSNTSASVTPDASTELYPTPAQMLSASSSSSASFQFTAAAAALALSNEPILAPGRYVAAKVARSHELWILARIVRFSDISNAYEVEDVDAGDRHHIVPKHQVVELMGDVLPEGEWIQYAVNQRVMAMYPNTTSFYRATIRVPNPKVRRMREPLYVCSVHLATGCIR